MSHFQIILYVLILLFLLIIGAFFSCSETGLMAVNRYRLRHQARLKKRYAVRILHLLKRPDRMLGAILIGNTFANTLASSLATLLALHFVGENAAILCAIFLTFIILIFSEIMPKTLAAIYPDKIVRLVGYPIQIVLTILYPLVWLSNAISNGLLRLVGINVANYALEPLSREELRSVVYDATGKISRQYQAMLLGILDLHQLTVDDIMIPQHEIVGIDFAQPVATMIEKMNELNQDWVPVYRENMNQVMGVLYIRDIMKLWATQIPVTKELLQQFLQEPYFVPEGTSLGVQLASFRQRQDKIAFIVDEYGEIEGMITLNDILEEIVGDVKSSATSGKRLQLQPDGSYLVDGSMTIREFNRSTEWALPLRGPRTINGLIVEHLEALPHTGTAILITRHPIEIVQVKENRVRLAKIFPKLK